MSLKQGAAWVVVIVGIVGWGLVTPAPQVGDDRAAHRRVAEAVR